MNETVTQTKKLGAGVGQSLVLALLVVVLLLMGFTFYYVSVYEGYDARYRNAATDEQLLTQRFDRAAQGVALNEATAFAMLKQSRMRFEQNLTLLEQGDSNTGLPPSPAMADPAFKSLKEHWSAVRGNIDLVLVACQSLGTASGSAGSGPRGGACLLGLLPFLGRNYSRPSVWSIRSHSYSTVQDYLSANSKNVAVRANRG